MFICSTTSNLNNFKPQQLQPQKRAQNEKKKQNRRPEPRKHTKDPPIAALFFGTMRLFETFWIAPKAPPSFVSIFCNTMDVKKSQRIPPFTFFGTVTLFKNLILIFFLEIFSCPQRVPLQFFFHILQPVGVSQSPKCPPFSILSLRYGADFGRSRLVYYFSKYKKDRARRNYVGLQGFRFFLKRRL